LCNNIGLESFLNHGDVPELSCDIPRKYVMISYEHMELQISPLNSQPSNKTHSTLKTKVWEGFLTSWNHQQPSRAKHKLKSCFSFINRLRSS